MRPYAAFLLITLLACRDKDTEIAVDTATYGPTDADGDGFSSTDDCNDSDGSISPGATERCDGIDNNCDGQIDEGVSSTWYADADTDGYGDVDSTMDSCEPPSGYVPTGTDCDDTDADRFPGATEECDGKDNDCDDEVDENLGRSWYADADGDGWGDPDASTEVCDPDKGLVVNRYDCDYTYATVNPDG